MQLSSSLTQFFQDQLNSKNLQSQDNKIIHLFHISLLPLQNGKCRRIKSPWQQGHCGEELRRGCVSSPFFLPSWNYTSALKSFQPHPSHVLIRLKGPNLLKPSQSNLQTISYIRIDLPPMLRRKIGKQLCKMLKRPQRSSQIGLKDGDERVLPCTG